MIPTVRLHPFLLLFPYVRSHTGHRGHGSCDVRSTRTLGSWIRIPSRGYSRFSAISIKEAHAQALTVSKLITTKPVLSGTWTYGKPVFSGKISHRPNDPGFKYLCETESPFNVLKISAPCYFFVGGFHSICNLDGTEGLINSS